MTSRERFKAAAAMKQPDHPPVDYMASKKFDKKIRRELDLKTEEELLDYLNCDFYYLSVRDISQNESSATVYRGPVLETAEKSRKCPFGITYSREAGNHKFSVDEALEAPLSGISSPEEISAYPWPDPKWFIPDPLIEEAERNRERVIIGGFWTGIYGHANRMLGTERFLYDMAANPEIVHAIIRRMTAFYLELNSRFFSALKNKIDIHFWGNDFGTQKGLLISVQMWRDFYEESYRRLIELAHSFGLKVMIHSCGAVRDLLPVFSELGIDILDPVQTGAAGMEPEGLKRDFGEQLIFHGGIDTQKVLPNGREDEVKSHVREMIDILGRSGGYICCSSNNIQTDTPVKNVTAMYEEIIR